MFKFPKLYLSIFFSRTVSKGLLLTHQNKMLFYHTLLLSTIFYYKFDVFLPLHWVAESEYCEAEKQYSNPDSGPSNYLCVFLLLLLVVWNSTSYSKSSWNFCEYSKCRKSFSVYSKCDTCIPSNAMKWVCEPKHTHTNLRKIKWSSAITRLTAHCMCGPIMKCLICKCSMTPNVLTETFFSRIIEEHVTHKLYQNFGSIFVSVNQSYMISIQS